MNTLNIIFNPQISPPRTGLAVNPIFSGATQEKKGAGSCEDPALDIKRHQLLGHRILCNQRSGRTLPGQAASPRVFRDVTHRGVEGTVFPFLNVAFDRVHHQLRQFQTGVIRLMALRQVIRGLAAHDH